MCSRTAPSSLRARLAPEATRRGRPAGTCRTSRRGFCSCSSGFRQEGRPQAALSPSARQGGYVTSGCHRGSAAIRCLDVPYRRLCCDDHRGSVAECHSNLSHPLCPVGAQGTSRQGGDVSCLLTAPTMAAEHRSGAGDELFSHCRRPERMPGSSGSSPALRGPELRDASAAKKGRRGGRRAGWGTEPGDEQGRS